MAKGVNEFMVKRINSCKHNGDIPAVVPIVSGEHKEILDVCLCDYCYRKAEEQRQIFREEWEKILWLRGTLKRHPWTVL